MSSCYSCNKGNANARRLQEKTTISTHFFGHKKKTRRFLATAAVSANLARATRRFFTATRRIRSCHTSQSLTPHVAITHATRRIFTCHTSQERPSHVASQFSNESNVKMACNCRQNLHDSALPTLEPTLPKRTVAQSDKCSECRFVGFFREKITGYKPPFAAKMRKGQKKTNAPKLSSERSFIIILLCCAVYSSAGVSSATGSATGASSTAGVSATGAATGAPSATTVKGTCAATSLCSFTVAT